MRKPGTKRDAEDPEIGTWRSFVGVATDASALPRFRDMMESLLDDRAKQQSAVDTEAIERGLAPFREALKSSGLEPILQELAIIQDSPPSQSPDSKANLDTYAFGSFVTCYLEATASAALVAKYDSAISQITKSGTGMAILGHLGAFTHPFWVVGPFTIQQQSRSRERISAQPCFARKASFRFSFHKTRGEPDPIAIPRQLIGMLQTPPTLLQPGTYAFLLFPFYRPTVSRRIFDPMRGKYQTSFSNGGDHGNTPGGILFSLCSVDPSLDLDESVRDAAWRIQLLISQALILEARHDVAAERRHDISILFHALRGNLNLARGITSHLEDVVASVRDQIPQPIVSNLSVNFSRLSAELKRMLAIAESCRTAFRDQYSEAPTTEIEATQFVSVALEEHLAKNSSHQITFSLRWHGRAPASILWSIDHIDLVFLEMVRNAAKYGDWGDPKYKLECTFSQTNDGLVVISVTNRVPAYVNLADLREIIRHRERFLGFTHLDFLASAILKGTDTTAQLYPRYEILDADRTFTVTMPLGRAAKA